MKKRRDLSGGVLWVLLAAVTLGVMVLCVCLGSVSIPPSQILQVVTGGSPGGQAPGGSIQSIILNVRLPRVLCAALMGAALSLCGVAMQGLLRNPLADGSTLGVSSGATLGAVLSIALGTRLPWLGGLGSTVMAMLFAFASLLIIMFLARKFDPGLTTTTIILLGIIFSMFTSSLTSLVISFSGDKLRSIIFWTLGSLSANSYGNVLTLLVALAVCAPVLVLHSRELNAFSVGEDNAQYVGIQVTRVKVVVLVVSSMLIGVCVSIGGTIGFVGLVIPHITRMLTGPNHARLLPATLFSGAVFMMLADLLSRSLLSPRELPIGVVTSIVGACVFLVIFYRTRRLG